MGRMKLMMLFFLTNPSRLVWIESRLAGEAAENQLRVLVCVKSQLRMKPQIILPCSQQNMMHMVGCVPTQTSDRRDRL